MKITTTVENISGVDSVRAHLLKLDKEPVKALELLTRVLENGSRLVEAEGKELVYSLKTDFLIRFDDIGYGDLDEGLGNQLRNFLETEGWNQSQADTLHSALSVSFPSPNPLAGESFQQKTFRRPD